MPGSFVWQSRVRFVDTDASRRIHYTAMLRHFEAAEFEFLRSLGVPYAGAGAGPLSYPRARIECDYLGPVSYDDLLDVAVHIDRVGSSSFTLAFEASVAGRPAARGKIVVVCMHRDTQKSHPLPEDFAAALRRASP